MRKAFFSILLGLAYLVSGIFFLFFAMDEYRPYSDAQTVVVRIITPLLCVILVYEGLHSFYNAVLTAIKTARKKGYVTEEDALADDVWRRDTAVLASDHARCVAAATRMLKIGLRRENVLSVYGAEIVSEAELKTKERHARILAVKRLLELGMSRESLVMICSEEFVREAELSTATPELGSD